MVDLKIRIGIVNLLDKCTSSGPVGSLCVYIVQTLDSEPAADDVHSAVTLFTSEVQYTTSSYCELTYKVIHSRIFNCILGIFCQAFIHIPEGIRRSTTTSK